MQSLSGILPCVARQSSRPTLTSARSLHSHVASNSPAVTPAAATPAAAATTSKLANSNSLRLYVWGGGQVSFRARAQSGVGGLLHRIFGDKPRAGPATSNSPLHKLTLRPTEVASPDGTGFRDVGFGHTHGAIVTGKGDLFTYGSGTSAQLGLGAKEEWVDQPRMVHGVGDVVQVACGRYHTLVLTESGEVYAFGRGDSFTTTSAIGTLERTEALTPRRVEVPAGVKIAQISAGSVHSLLRSTTGQVYAFGQGEYGRLGTGSSSAEKFPVLLQALERHRIVHIVSGSSFNGALSEEGSVFTWGRHEKGQLGLGVGISPDQSAMESVPTRVEFPEETEGVTVRVRKLAAGYKHMLALGGTSDADKKLYTWGNSLHTSPHRSPFDYASSFVSVGGGDHFSVACDSEGALASWGKGAAGCLGHGNRESLNEPLFITGFGSSVERAGVGGDASKYFGRVEYIKAGHNHCAVLARR